MKKRDLIKGVLGFSASVGAGMIVTSVTRATTPGDAGKIVRFFRGVGSFAIGGALGDVAEGWIGKQVDQVAEGYDGIVNAVKGIQEEVAKEAGVVNITTVSNKE